MSFGLEWCRPIERIEEKKIIANRLSALVANNDTIGVGSGSTSFVCLQAIAERVRSENLNVVMVVTSLEMLFACEELDLSVSHSIPSSVDWCFDGADEVDKNGRLIKGRGGALFRERLLFIASSKRYVIADSSKDVNRLGEKFLVPIEVKPDCVRFVYRALSSWSAVNVVKLRTAVSKDGPVITEQGCVILDVGFNEISSTLNSEIMQLPGVLGTGIFEGFSFERI
jgi:ribose 5-phosphate isomerase A